MLAWASWALPFSSPGRERAYQWQQVELARRQDVLTGVVSFVLWVLALLRYRSTLGLLQWSGSVALALPLLVPAAWSKLLGPESYCKHRLSVVVCVRLTVALQYLFVPSLNVSTAASLPDSTARWLTALPFVLSLPRLYFASLGYRLPFWLHCPVHAITVAAFLRSMPELCRSPYFLGEPYAQYMRTASSMMSQVLAMFGGLVGELRLDIAGGGGSGGSGLERGALPATPSPLSPLCSCVGVLASFTVVLGHLAPSVLIAVSERRTRQAYVSWRLRNLQEGGWVRADLEQNLLYDWLPAAVLFASMLPVLLGVAWELSLLVAVRTGACA